ncbi:MAG: BamA/TamA family outer membrane protein [Bacteroidales bacterium]|nr:BamA/TamA family outer membrane protein [Bacteroidales bacterium]
MRNSHISYIFSLLIALILIGCGPSKELTQPGYLLNKNKITTDNKEVSAKVLENYLQQQPNKRFLGLVRMNIWIYKQAGRGEDRKYKKWFREKLGKEPVMLDSTLADNACNDMKLYLDNIGYFNSAVTRQITYKKKKAKVNFFVTSGEPSRYNQISYSIEDDTLAKFIMDEKKNSLIKPGDLYNVYTLNKERDRVTTDMRNQGYFYFSKNFINYTIDSTLQSHSMDLVMTVQNIQQPVEGIPDSVSYENHKRYLINNIFINTDFGTVSKGAVLYDTIVYYPRKMIDTDSSEWYYFLYKDIIRIKPSVLSQSMYFKSGDLYRIRDVQESIKKLSGYQITRMVNIDFDEESPAEPKAKTTYGRLDCHVMITRAPVNSFTVETDLTNSAGNPGIAANLILQNKNLFRGADVFRIKLRGAFEAQLSSQESQNKSFFNSAEYGIETSLQFPQFLIPIRQERFPKYFKPSTSIILSFLYQLRVDYTRYQPKLAFGYNWASSEKSHHSFYPIDIQSVKIFPDDSSAFFKYVNESNDLRLKEQYTDHLIMAMKYNYIFSTQKLNRPVNFSYLSYSVETAGNLLSGISTLGNANRNEDGKYTVLDIPFAQYIRNALDFRYYAYFDPKRIFVTRGLFAIGVPYGNSEVLPFEKGFFGGGANDMRGWEWRRLGPGSFSPDTIIGYDKQGDIKIMVNGEYRFPVFKSLQGALFTDIGNIWLLNESEEFPGGEFAFNTFMDEMAVDVGVGFRLDFNFFIFRLDLAIPARDPARPNGERWFFNTSETSRAYWNFGIGYPF